MQDKRQHSRDTANDASNCHYSDGIKKSYEVSDTGLNCTRLTTAFDRMMLLLTARIGIRNFTLAQSDFPYQTHQSCVLSADQRYLAVLGFPETVR